jgi:hypothetical protein
MYSCPPWPSKRGGLFCWVAFVAKRTKSRGPLTEGAKPADAPGFTEPRLATVQSLRDDG